MENYNEEILSIVQGIRSENGRKYEKYLYKKFRSLGLENNNISVIDEVGHTWTTDLGLGKTLFEVTSSADYGKSLSVAQQAKTYKEYFPDCKFVFIVEKPKQKNKLGVDAVLVQTFLKLYVDDVLIGDEEVYEYITNPNFISRVRNVVKNGNYKNTKDKQLKQTINYKPSKIMNTSKLDLIKYFVDNGEYDYATKTLSELDETSKPKTGKRPDLDTSKLPQNKRAAARMKWLRTYGVKAHDPELNLPRITESLEIQNAYSFVNRSDSNVMEFADSGSLYENEKGTQDFCHDAPVLVKYRQSLN